MKIIAYYLPQFHEIPENNEWWGKGFTEWTNVKSAKPIFNGHEQPKIPLDDNYYDLMDDNVKIWQANLAKSYGIYGFCYYHYWFSGKLLLEKPMEQMLKNPRVDIPFCICWANETWTKRWVGNNSKILIKQLYGDREDWEAHYRYLSQFFKDKRYIFENNKPLIVIYKPELIDCIKEMLVCWDELAKKDGFEGLTFMCCIKDYNVVDESTKYFDYIINWEPSVSISYMNGVNKSNNTAKSKLMNIRTKFYDFFEKRFKFNFEKIDPFVYLYKLFNKNKIKYIEFKKVAEYSNIMPPISMNNIPGGFVRVDNSPRYKDFGSGTYKENPMLFKDYIVNLVKRAKDVYKKDYIFFYAWNEWAEGGFLEPENIHKYGYLEAIKEAVQNNI